MGPLEILLTGFPLFLEALSDRVVLSNAAGNIILFVIRIIAGSVRVGGLLGLRHPRSLAKGAESCFDL